MIEQDNDIVFFRKIRNLFKRQKPIIKGQFGIYHYVWVFDTLNTNLKDVKCDVFVKVRAIEIYDHIVEVEVVDIHISGFTNDDIMKTIKSVSPRYVDPRMIQWQVIELFN